MFLPTWTPTALSSEARRHVATCWRVVEAQHVASTMKLVDTPDEQALLEDILEESKPPIPEECAGLHYLLFTPFRYRNRHGGSRFRPPDEPRGVFYAAEHLHTALCEAAFWRLLFFLESPETPWPANPLEHTAFSVRVDAACGIDLTLPPFDAHEDVWTQPADYAACQQLAALAREAGINAIRYRSVRSQQPGVCNIALLACDAFAKPKPLRMQSWKLQPGAFGMLLLCDGYPRERFTLPPDHFANDPRFHAMRWQRP